MLKMEDILNEKEQYKLLDIKSAATTTEHYQEVDDPGMTDSGTCNELTLKNSVNSHIPPEDSAISDIALENSVSSPLEGNKDSKYNLQTNKQDDCDDLSKENNEDLIQCSLENILFSSLITKDVKEIDSDSVIEKLKVDNITKFEAGPCLIEIPSLEAENMDQTLPLNNENDGNIETVFKENIKESDDVKEMEVIENEIHTVANNVQQEIVETKALTCYSSSSSEELSSEESSSDNDSTTDDDAQRNDLEVEEKCVKVPNPLTTPKEIKPEELPEVEYLEMVLDQNVEMRPLGVVSSIIGQLVIIKSLPNTPALDTETVLFKEDRQALGKVFEVFGPVQSPLYSMRFNSVAEIATLDINLQLTLFYAPSSLDLTAYIFTSQLLKMKGSDASWKGDEEPPLELLDYSDDEQEKLAKARKKQSKDPVKRKVASQRVSEKNRIDEDKGQFRANAGQRKEQANTKQNKNQFANRNYSNQGNTVRETWTQRHSYEQYQPPTSYQDYQSMLAYPLPFQSTTNNYGHVPPRYGQHPPSHGPVSSYGQTPFGRMPLPYQQNIPPNIPFPPPNAIFPGYPPDHLAYTDTSKPPPSMWNSHEQTSNLTETINRLPFFHAPPPPPPPT